MDKYSQAKKAIQISWVWIKKISVIVRQYVIQYIIPFLKKSFIKIKITAKPWLKYIVVSMLLGMILCQGLMISDLSKKVASHKQRIQDLESNWKLFEDMAWKKVDGVDTSTLKKVSDNKNLGKK